MITVVVHYGNHNKYSIDLPEDTLLGYLPCFLGKLINRAPADILYLVMGSCIIGNDPYTFNKTLADCNIVDKCVISMVLKDPSIDYPDADRYLCVRNLHWLQRHQTARPTQPTQSIEQQLAALLRETIGIEILDDVAVTIPVGEYEQYITVLDTPPEDTICAICSDNVGDDAVSLACGHVFDNNCIREWLTTRSVKCPSCNHDVRDSRS